MDALSSDTAVILVDHGSRFPAANAMLDEVAAAYAASSGAAIVEPAHMELAEPSIAEAFGRCVARGARKIIVHPYFLSPGRHSTSDIPAMTAEAAAAYPEIEWTVTEPLGLDPRMAEIIHRRVLEAVQSPAPR